MTKFAPLEDVQPIPTGKWKSPEKSDERTISRV